MDTLHILCRVSTSSQEEENGGTSLKTQTDQGIELSKKLKMKYQIHNEGGTSSSKDTLDNRPVMINLLRLMDEGVVKHLYVYNTDRISRGNTWYFIRKKMVDNQVILYTSTGRYDTTGTMENLILGILSEVSQYDNKVRTERSRLGKIEKVKQNYYRGGDPCFGFRIEKEQRGSRLVIDEFESSYVRLIYQMYNEGYKVTEIKSKLENDKVKTRRGNTHWSLGSIQLMLRNDTYIGIDEFFDKKSGITIRNEIPAIIPMKLFEMVQERRTRTLLRKGQMNRTVKDYLFRDFIFCECGTPIGGRIKPLKNIQHYYCPLSERKFNKSVMDDTNCDMKRCVNIDRTEDLLWNSIYEILSATTYLKDTLKEKLKTDISFTSKLRKQRNIVIKLLNNKQLELDRVTNGIVEIERKRILNEFTSEDVYSSLKTKLDSDYRRIHVEIEDLKNTLKLYNREDSWFETLESISEKLSSTTNWTHRLKRTILEMVLDKVILRHDRMSLLHTLEVNLRIPLVLTQIKKGDLLGAPFKLSSKPLKTQGNQLSTRSLYSTVTDFAKFLG
jgi:DNA invertase Pin-like site-specific DNA recombinase